MIHFHKPVAVDDSGKEKPCIVCKKNLDDHSVDELLACMLALPKK